MSDIDYSIGEWYSIEQTIASNLLETSLDSYFHLNLRQI